MKTFGLFLSLLPPPPPLPPSPHLPSLPPPPPPPLPPHPPLPPPPLPPPILPPPLLLQADICETNTFSGTWVAQVFPSLLVSLSSCLPVFLPSCLSAFLSPPSTFLLPQADYGLEHLVYDINYQVGREGKQ